MEETVIVVMLKDRKTGFLEKELLNLDITENVEYMVNIFAVDEEDGRKLHIRLSTKKDVKDWEYSAVYDYYDTECFSNTAEVKEADDDYNPVWEVVIGYVDDAHILEEKLSEILSIHKREIEEVFDVIKDKEKEYNYEG